MLFLLCKLIFPYFLSSIHEISYSFFLSEDCLQCANQFETFEIDWMCRWIRTIWNTCNWTNKFPSNDFRLSDFVNVSLPKFIRKSLNAFDWYSWSGKNTPSQQHPKMYRIAQVLRWVERTACLKFFARN